MTAANGRRAHMVSTAETPCRRLQDGQSVSVWQCVGSVLPRGNAVVCQCVSAYIETHYTHHCRQGFRTGQCVWKISSRFRTRNGRETGRWFGAGDAPTRPPACRLGGSLRARARRPRWLAQYDRRA